MNKIDQVISNDIEYQRGYKCGTIDTVKRIIEIINTFQKYTAVGYEYAACVTLKNRIEKEYNARI